MYIRISNLSKSFKMFKNLKFWKNHCYYCNKVTQNKTIYIKVTYNKKRQLCDYCYNVYIKYMITYKKRFKTLELY